MADVALSRLKAGGKYYAAGEEVPSDLEDADSLKERGVIGSSSDFDKQENEKKDAAEAAEEAQAEADAKQAEADDLRNKASGVLVPPVSVTDMEAAELNKKDEEETPAPAKASATKASDK